MVVERHSINNIVCFELLNYFIVFNCCGLQAARMAIRVFVVLSSLSDCELIFSEPVARKTKLDIFSSILGREITSSEFQYHHLEPLLDPLKPSQLSGGDDTSVNLGDDLCGLLANKKIKNLPNKVFPKGMPVRI